MSDECCHREQAGSATCELTLPTSTAERPGAGCPVCHAAGKLVQGQTVKALLAVSLRAVVEEANYRFCRTPDCPVVYYAEDGTSTFTVEQVRERVYQKELANPEVFVCYCFHHTAAELLDASADGQHTILDDINRGIQAGQCACDLRNPQGSCCLGNVLALVRRSMGATVG